MLSESGAMTYHPDMDDIDSTWGSAGEETAGIMIKDAYKHNDSFGQEGVDVEVLINADEMIGISVKHSSDKTVDVLLMTMDQATVVRDALTTAITEGVWLV
jgi:hypothetical protein